MSFRLLQDEKKLSWGAPLGVEPVAHVLSIGLQTNSLLAFSYMHIGADLCSTQNIHKYINVYIYTYTVHTHTYINISYL